MCPMINEVIALVRRSWSNGVSVGGRDAEKRLKRILHDRHSGRRPGIQESIIFFVVFFAKPYFVNEKNEPDEQM